MVFGDCCREQRRAFPRVIRTWVLPLAGERDGVGVDCGAP
jgi:hypothetical protein